jgi:hypothetical protein
MEMPKLTDAHLKLSLLSGTWHGEEVLFPTPWDPYGGPAAGRVVNRVALDGFALVQDYEQQRGGSANFRGHGVFSWDSAKKSYMLYWFDSLGMGQNVFDGSFDEKVLVLTNQSPVGFTRASWDLTSPLTYFYRMEVSGDGTQWQKVMEGSYARVD